MHLRNPATAAGWFSPSLLVGASSRHERKKWHAAAVTVPNFEVGQAGWAARRRGRASSYATRASSANRGGAEFANESGIFNEIFQGLSYDTVFSAAEQESETIGSAIPDGEWFYGEFTFESFVSMLQQVSPAPGSIFVDLGSGAGKALFSAALGLPPGTFSECRGVEILPGLAQQSRAALSRYSTFAESRGLPPVVIECENMFYSNVWMDADLVYCFATVLGPESQMLLQQRIEDMKSGSRALIVSKRLTSPLLKETEIFELQMSHNGESLPCFLYERL